MSEYRAGRKSRRAAAAAPAVCGALFLSLLLSGCLQGTEPVPQGEVPEVRQETGPVGVEVPLEAPEPYDEAGNETAPAEAEDPAPLAEPELPQVESGEIQAPAGDPYGNCAWLEGSPAWLGTASSTFSGSFDVDGASWGRGFQLISSNGDVDIAFSGEALPHGVQFTKRSLAGETGIIPPGAERATVCLFAGGPTSYVYLGGLPASVLPEQLVQGMIEEPALRSPACAPLDASTASHGGGDDPAAFRIRIDPATWGKPFSLTPHQTADLDIHFDAGTGNPEGGFLSSRGFDPIEGVVPTDAREARVCVFAGGPTQFTYIAGDPVGS